MELTPQWTTVIITLLSVGSGVALYIFRLEMRNFVQNAISDAFGDIEVRFIERKKEIEKRVELVENEGRTLRQEIGAMSTAQSYMNSNIDKLELSMEKMENKLDNLISHYNDSKIVMNQIWDKIKEK